MDLSVITYFLLPVIILWGIYLAKPLKIIATIEFLYLTFINALLFFMLPANVLLYKYWGSLLSFRSLSYLKDAKEIAASFTGQQLIALLFFMSLFGVALFYSFRKYFFRRPETISATLTRKISGFVLLAFLTVITIRGGLQKLPMNESLVSFSDDNFLNQSAVNPVWHLANDIYRAGIFKGNPFKVMPEMQAEEYVKNLFACKQDSFPHLLTQQRPNIVFIILESFTADIVEALGGEKEITPYLN
jgi:phosphoglycerol transferase MdoB-like AlkP superfamily enzyme